ncbi:hypothetical protein GLYMA_01G053000v4 [Glycine max]|uniref:Myb/SANT-like domain-containing protein n=2 Tax=Glycine subgen. Soja TaxID=1462606 RepID=A0A0R0L6T5_SOYBN|nr:hypothetical protein GYH30_000552 [Glycine max]KRH74940.1 hypothetical protein GLYMA_01G053000v4 [Glycine max]RZC28588.1 hypothetical protein D0Y65_000530 [Glycine soja]
MKHKIPRIAINANQVVNKMKRWSTKPNDVVDMMNTSGFGWDDTRKCVTCDSSQKHPKVGNHVNKEFKEFEKLQSIFGKDRANGCGAEGCVDGMENEIGENQVATRFLKSFDSKMDMVTNGFAKVVAKLPGPSKSDPSKRDLVEEVNKLG